MRPILAAYAALLPRRGAPVARSLFGRRGPNLGRRLAPIAASVVLAASSLVAGPGSIPGVAAATNTAFPDLPVGFAKVQLAKGLKNPTAIACAPNGDIYIAQQKGAILLDRAGVIQAS